MIYKIHESSKVDEFIKTMPKKVPDNTEDIDEKEADKRFKDWHDLSDSEKKKILRMVTTSNSKANNLGYSRDTRYPKNKPNNSAMYSTNYSNLHPKNIKKYRDSRIADTKYESSIDLHGQDADNFLEHIGVSINTNNSTITIGEFTMDGYLGQTILAENGIILNEDCIIVEDKAVFNLLL